MDIIGFKHVSTDPSFTNFYGWVTPDYDIEDTQYTDVNDTHRRVVDVVYKQFNIRFGMLNTTLQDFLINMKSKPTPQMQYATFTYNFYIKLFCVRNFGATIEVLKTTKE